MDKSCLIDLNKEQLMNFSAGNRFKPLRYIWDAIAASDIVLSAIEGWNSVECGCNNFEGFSGTGIGRSSGVSGTW